MEQTVYQKASQMPGADASRVAGKYLIVIDPCGKPQEISLSAIGKDRIFFGRRQGQNDIVIPAPMVSGQHGKFKLDGNRLLYADLGSLNGTIIEADGYQKLLKGNSKYFEMRSGDILRIQPPDAEPENSVMILYMDSSEKGVWRKFPLLASRTKIGRDMGNDIVLKHPSVSRFHAEINRDGEKFILTDHDSRNGLYVNGAKLAGKRILREKDVIRISNCTLIYTGGQIFYKNSAQGINIVARNVYKYVGKNKLRILDNVNVTIESNEFVAIVGGSGAGKTTLMNAINGFDRNMEGSVQFNGLDVHKNFNELKDLMGYVPQEDIIYQNLTLRKMLTYTAKLKMGKDVSKKEQNEMIDQVLAMVELTEHQNKYIRKLSGGQKKRASIAVEMLGDPDVFFLDEPTSGLDPGTEQKLMITLNKLSKSQGKTIVMVTHSTQSLELCDKVIFMGRGGRLCFAGTTEEAKMYFDTDNLVDIYNMITENPEVYAEQFRNIQQADNVAKPSAGTKQIETKKKHTFPIRQVPILTTRYMELIKNDMQRLLLLFAQPLLIALLLTVVANDDAFKLWNDTQSILFALSCAGIWIGLFNSIQEVCKERAILKREYMANLKLPFYVFSKFFVQTLLGAIQALIVVGVFTLVVGAPDAGILMENPFLETWITMWVTIEASMALGFVVSCLVKSGDRAMTFAPFILIIQLLFSGILFALKGASEKVAYVTVSKWSVEALCSIAGLNDMPNAFEVDNPDMVKQMPDLGHAIKDAYEATASHLWSNWGIMMLMVLICAIACTILLRSVAKDNR